MRQCELERVVREKGNPQLKRTGEKLVSFVDSVTPGMEGSIIELKAAVCGLLILFMSKTFELHQLKRLWCVNGA